MDKPNLLKISKQIYSDNKIAIQERISVFDRIREKGTNEEFFFELVYCILAAVTSAELAFKVHNILKQDRFVIKANKEQIIKKLKTCYRFYNLRGAYIYETREFLKNSYDFNLRKIVRESSSPELRRRFFVEKKEIVGVRMKVASHFLRNIGFNDYAILDKHVIEIMKEFNLIDSLSKVPTNTKNYIKHENVLKDFGKQVNLTMGQLDFVLWYYKTGKFIK